MRTDRQRTGVYQNVQRQCRQKRDFSAYLVPKGINDNGDQAQADTAVYADTQRKSRTKPPQGQRNVLCKENVLQPGRLQQAIKEIHERVQQLPDAPPGLEVPQ